MNQTNIGLKLYENDKLIGIYNKLVKKYDYLFLCQGAEIFLRYSLRPVAQK